MKKISPFNWFLLGVIAVACIAAATTLKSLVIQNDLVVQGNLYCSNSIYTPLFGVGTLVITNAPAFNNTATTNAQGQTINQQLATNANWSQQFGYGPLTNWGASGYITAGNRTLLHDANQTVIQNTGTLTSNVWSGGSEKLYYNGTPTIEDDKTNGLIRANTFVSPTNYLPQVWATYTINTLKTYQFIRTNGAFALAFDALPGINATNFSNGLVEITNDSTSAGNSYPVTIAGVNPPNSSVTLYVTNGMVNFVGWARTKYGTNVWAFDTYKAVLK